MNTKVDAWRIPFSTNERRKHKGCIFSDIRWFSVTMILDASAASFPRRFCVLSIDLVFLVRCFSCHSTGKMSFWIEQGGLGTIEHDYWLGFDQPQSQILENFSFENRIGEILRISHSKQDWACSSSITEAIVCSTLWRVRVAKLVHRPQYSQLLNCCCNRAQYPFFVSWCMVDSCMTDLFRLGRKDARVVILSNPNWIQLFSFCDQKIPVAN